MARIEYVTKQLHAAWFEVNAEEYVPNSFYAKKSNRARTEIISFHSDGGTVRYFNVRGSEDRDDLSTDYFAGTYTATIKNAIHMADSSLASSLRVLDEHESGECTRIGRKCGHCWREIRAAAAS